MNDPITFHPAIRQATVFAEVRDSDFDILVPALLRRHLGVGDRVYRQGERGDSMVIVADGELAVWVRGEGGNERELDRLGPGQVVGEMACLDPAPRSATVVASEPTLALELNRNLLTSLRSYAPQLVSSIVRGIIQHVTARLSHADRLIGEALGEPEAEVLAPEGAPRPSGRPLEPGSPPQGLDPQTWALFQARGRGVWLAHGDALCHQGERADRCYLLVEGRVEVLRRVRHREEPLATLEAGDWVGQAALVDRSPAPATVRARGPVQALELSRRAFEELLASGTPQALDFQERIAVAGIRQLRLVDRFLADLAGGAPPVPVALDGQAVAIGRIAIKRAPARTWARTRSALGEWSLDIAEE